jgi:hypothetical protein
MHDGQTGVLTILIAAGLVGAVIGIASMTTTPQGRTAVEAVGTRIAVNAGVQRLRAPKAGDHWGGCNDARAAGTASIYRGEPGYREDMDGDGDGEACEPIR